MSKATLSQAEYERLAKSKAKSSFTKRTLIRMWDFFLNNLRHMTVVGRDEAWTNHVRDISARGGRLHAWSGDTFMSLGERARIKVG